MNNSQRKSFHNAQRVLAILWFIAVIPCLVVMLVRTLTIGAYQEMWEWFLPTVMPTLLLIVGTSAAESSKVAATKKTVSNGHFVLTIVLSTCYLVAVNVIVFYEPFIAKVPHIDVVRETSLILGPFQGLVAASLASFFSSSG